MTDRIYTHDHPGPFHEDELGIRIGGPYTLSAIGDIMGVTRQAVFNALGRDSPINACGFVERVQFADRDPEHWLAVLPFGGQVLAWEMHDGRHKICRYLGVSALTESSLYQALRLLIYNHAKDHGDADHHQNISV